MRKALTALVALTWAVVLLGGPFRPQSPTIGNAARVVAGVPAPPLAVENPDGTPFDLAAYRGKTVFLNFWASWCPPCRLEMPEVQRLAGNLPEGAALITVNLTVSESSPEAVRQFLQENGYTFPVTMDPSGAAADAYEVLSLPTSFIIDPKGVITARVNGPLTYGAMLDYLRSAGR